MYSHRVYKYRDSYVLYKPKPKNLQYTPLVR